VNIQLECYLVLTISLCEQIVNTMKEVPLKRA